MANELTGSASLVFTKNSNTFRHAVSIVDTISGTDGLQSVQNIGTSNEVINFGDTAPGYVFIENQDPTNYVEIFLDNSNAELACKLLAGDFCILKLDGATPLYARANTGACDCMVLALPL